MNPESPNKRGSAVHPRSFSAVQVAESSYCDAPERGDGLLYQAGDVHNNFRLNLCVHRAVIRHGNPLSLGSIARSERALSAL